MREIKYGSTVHKHNELVKLYKSLTGDQRSFAGAGLLLDTIVKLRGKLVKHESMLKRKGKPFLHAPELLSTKRK